MVQLTRQLGAKPITEREVQQVRDLERKQQLLQAQLHASATRIQWSFDAQTELQLNGQNAQNQGERFLADATELRLGELGTIQITPGADNAKSLAESLKHVSATLTDRLAAFQAQSGAALEQLLLSAQGIGHELALAQQRLKTLAPDGLATLQALCDNQQIQLTQINHELTQAGETSDAVITASEGHIADALSVAKEELDRAHQMMVQTEREQVNAQAVWASAQREHQAVAAIIAQTDYAALSENAREQIAADNKQLLMVNERLATLTKELELAQPDALSLIHI